MPTLAGDSFLKQAERVLAEVERLHDQMDDFKELRRGRVAIGVLPRVGTRLLPDILRAYQRRYPEVELMRTEQDLDASSEFQRRVHQGELDLAVVRMPTTLLGLRSQTLVREPIVALLPPGHRLGGQHSVHLAELADEVFVALRSGSGLHTLMKEMCDQAVSSPRCRWKPDSNTTPET
ncbi:LysR family transcriptional regulator, hydrogen peroxide-inducible genes activator [Saccharopolyspora antimicrobica]|uniref:LysR family transcriptional regulator, hydrogen peroxide-inducible genes activator n=1 Tax=Saccharopolyspora antimicrobica TaxID=455193 RepID=A0A1I4W267_9PSEU|nr:LysR family transcriptional regulator, hydrogen peroxide-inducible genes activator [Saccharopolyspora antimicrobica]